MKDRFPYDCNPHSLDLETEILRWAWDANLFEYPAELERCRVQKVNRFAGYLYPRESKERLQPIMKLFLCLFLLDDILDYEVNEEMVNILEDIRRHKIRIESRRIEILSNHCLKMHLLLKETMKTEILRQEWEEYWFQYLGCLQWELINKLERKAPNFIEYRMQRPHSSGVFLAVHLLRNEYSPRDCEAELLEREIARLICFSNDIASYNKELSIGDFHNELILIFGENNEKALAWGIKERKKIVHKIHSLSDLIRAKSNDCDQWIDHLHLMVGGCLFWGEESLRYQNYINGKPSQLK